MQLFLACKISKIFSEKKENALFFFLFGIHLSFTDYFRVYLYGKRHQQG